jgi:drug/metabolite transporter (DMT)-like permease
LNDLDLRIVGETTALATSCLWTFDPLFFTSAGKKIGSFSVNAYRSIIALGFLAITHSILLGTILPAATSGQWFWMGMSGIVNFGVGDFAFFAALVMIGPRRTVLVASSSPIFASVAAYLMLGETIPLLGIVGIAITLGGIVVVVLEEEQRSGEERVSRKVRNQGLFLVLVNAIGQGVGLAFSKKGIYLNPGTTLDPLSAALMRMFWGAVFVWIIVVASRRLPDVRKAVGSKGAIMQTAAGAFVGNFVGMTLSMVAVTYTDAGIALTLMSLRPVVIIPVVLVLYKQRTSFRGVLGAMMAVIGVSILFLT